VVTTSVAARFGSVDLDDLERSEAMVQNIRGLTADRPGLTLTSRLNRGLRVPADQ
jgi:hypothetical protein